MLILVALPSFLSRQAATISSGSSSSVAQNSRSSSSLDSSSLGSTPDCSRSPRYQVLTESYSSSGLFIDAIVVFEPRATLSVRLALRSLLGKTEHPRERFDFLFSPRKRRLRLDHLRRLHLLGHLGIALEGLPEFALEEDLLQRRTRTLSTCFPRLRRITDQQHPQRNPVLGRLHDLVDRLALKCRQADAKSLVNRGEHRLANRDTCVRCGGRRHRWLVRAFGQRFQDVRPNELIDELMAPSVGDVQCADVDQLLQPRLSTLVCPHICVGVD